MSNSKKDNKPNQARNIKRNSSNVTILVKRSSNEIIDKPLKSENLNRECGTGKFITVNYSKKPHRPKLVTRKNAELREEKSNCRIPPKNNNLNILNVVDKNVKKIYKNYEKSSFTHRPNDEVTLLNFGTRKFTSSIRMNKQEVSVCHSGLDADVGMSTMASPNDEKLLPSRTNSKWFDSPSHTDKEDKERILIYTGNKMSEHVTEHQKNRKTIAGTIVGSDVIQNRDHVWTQTQQETSCDITGNGVSTNDRGSNVYSKTLMLPSHPDSSYSRTVHGIRHGNKYRQVNEQKTNMTAIDVKKIHQAHKRSSEYPTKETNSYHHHHDHHSYQNHQQHHHPMAVEQPIIRSIDTNKILVQTTPNIRTTTKSRQCSNCCGGLPGRGPGSGLTVTKSRQSVQGQCCCQNKTTVPQPFNKHSGNMSISHELSLCPDDKRLRGGGSTNKLSYTRNFVPSPTGSTNEETSWNENFENISKTDNPNIRSRGGCGGCDFPQSIKSYSTYNSASRDQYQSPCPSSYKYPRRRPCPPLPVCFTKRKICAPENFRESAKGCCPCGGCGGAACSDNPGGGQIDGGCCGGGQAKGLPCKCKCQSCKDFHPCGGCGGQSCGKIYSCAGSSGGTCCFPRNYKRRSGPECCGGGNSGCGGCC